MNKLFRKRIHKWRYIFEKQGRGTIDVALTFNLDGQTPHNIFDICCGNGNAAAPFIKM